MNQLKVWMKAATPAQKVALADLAGTTVGTLNQIAGGYRKAGVTNVGAGLARKIELAVKALRKQNSQLPEVLRTDLSTDCRGCEFAQKCLGDRASLSGFNILSDEKVT